MSSLTVAIVKNSRILAGIYFIFAKNSLDKLERFSIPNLRISEKIGKTVFK